MMSEIIGETPKNTKENNGTNMAKTVLTVKHTSQIEILQFCFPAKNVDGVDMLIHEKR